MSASAKQRLEQSREARLVQLVPRDGDHGVVERIRGCRNVNARQAQTQKCCADCRSFVPVHKRLSFGEVKCVGRSDAKNIGTSIVEIVPRLRNRALKSIDVSNSWFAPMLAERAAVQLQYHFASQEGDVRHNDSSLLSEPLHQFSMLLEDLVHRGGHVRIIRMHFPYRRRRVFSLATKFARKSLEVGEVSDLQAAHLLFDFSNGHTDIIPHVPTRSNPHFIP
jgi:hypothetical protein